MSTKINEESALDAESAKVTGTPAEMRPRLWSAVFLTVVYWSYFIGIRQFDFPISFRFLTTVGAAALFTLLFAIWWLTNRHVAWRDRSLGLGVLFGTVVVAAFAVDPSIGPPGILFFGIPVALTAWVLWLLVSRNASLATQRVGSMGVVLVVFGLLTLVRVDGVDGSDRVAAAWRWNPSAEDHYLAGRARSADTAVNGPTDPPALADGDWAEFRGPHRQSELHSVQIASDWKAHPPKEVWRQKIGPAWSSVLVIGPRLYTAEQRGAKEAVVCLDAASGRELWSHEDAVRWSDGQAGAGPRATPTFADGRIYSFGATAVLNCLDAATGKLIWTRDVAKETSAPAPMWGFSSSPLVSRGIVIVYAGGPDDKGLMGYLASTGELAWSAAAGAISYCSPQLVTLAGKDQVVFLGDDGVISVDPETGKQNWVYESAGHGTWRVVQPRQIAEDALLAGSEDMGLVRLQVTRGDDGNWTVSEKWTTRALRPAYNDFVISEGYAYGFDEAIFACVNLETGKRQWKKGRYGHGQVLLVADQKLLVVISESGELVLVAAKPDGLEELARLQALTGKTWNHPVIAHGRLYVRNDQEIACYQVDGK